MTKYSITNRSSGHCLGVFQATDERSALDVMARNAGADDYRDLCNTTDPENLDDEVERGIEDLLVLEVRDVNKDTALISAIAKARSAIARAREAWVVDHNSDDPAFIGVNRHAREDWWEVVFSDHEQPDMTRYASDDEAVASYRQTDAEIASDILFCWDESWNEDATPWNETPAGVAFVASGDSRETSLKIMEAIASFASSTVEAERLWDGDGSDIATRLDIWEYVTDNGQRAAENYCWGAAGSNWADDVADVRA